MVFARQNLNAAFVGQSLLRRDQIRYTVVPVLGYEHLRQQAAKYLFDATEYRSIILIDCGAVVDVAAFLKLDQDTERAAFVIDYHRPVHRANIHNATNVVVFADTEHVPDPQPASLAPPPPPPALDDDDDDLDDRSGDRDRDSPSKRQKGDGGNADLDESPPERDFGDDFASGSFYGTSSAYLMHELAAQLAADTPRALWLAIVGLTEHYLLHRCSVKQYLKHLEALRVSARIADDKTLQYERFEYQFVLYRHWTLYESMFHSPQIATRLGIWAEGGRRRLDQLLAKMGFPLNQCHQRFAMMSVEMKQQLPRQLEEYASDFGLADITFPSFVKTLDNKLRLSAADCVHAISALIEVGVPRTGRGLDTQFERDTWQADLLRAYSALASENPEEQVLLMGKGLSSAIALQQALVREGVDLLLKKIIVRNGPFRYGLLHESSAEPVFCHWQSLTRLALFVLEALKKPNKASKPLVLCALNRERNSYLVLGVTPAAPSTRAKRNDFGISFHQAARLTGTDVHFHSFDSSVIEVGAADISRFLELLHSGLIAE